MPVKSRRPARVAALQALYKVEVGKTTASAAMGSIEGFQSLEEELASYARRLIDGVIQSRRELDQKLSEKLQDWDIERMAAVDRNILRLGAYELLHCPEIPPRVTLNEMIEIAKKFSTAESGKFVNGVLAAVLADSAKADWAAPAAVEVEEAAEPEPEPEIEAINEDAPEAAELAKVGKWKLRSEDASE